MIEPTAKQQDLIEAAISGRYRLILFGGAIGGAKTAGLYLLFLIAQRLWPGLRVYFIRKNLPDITNNAYATWDELTGRYGIPRSLKRDRRFNSSNPYLEFKNGSRLIFFGENYDKDKELNRWKGLIPNWFFADEINELQYKTYLKMFERAGRFMLPKGDQPHPLIVGTCNPSQGWVKTEIYDKYKDGTLPPHMLYIPAKITDNPHLNQEYVENLKNLPVYQYQVFVEGNWDIKLKTGGEALKSFELDRHVVADSRELETIIHISIDNNTYPYITTTVWQIIKQDDRYTIRQINELLAKDPDNSAPKAGKKTAQYLRNIEYEDKIFVYGDPTTQARNTIDENKRSFYDKYTEQLKNWRIEKRMWKSNRSVSRMIDFVNSIMAGEHKDISFEVNEKCTTSISDYVETKQDVDGSVLKKRITDPETKISYEQNGHIVDTMKDFICQAFADRYRRYTGKRQKPLVDW